MSTSNKFIWFAAVWLLLLFAGSVYSPPTFVLDPGLGFLDLINFSEGGSFQYHKAPSLAGINDCVEIKTTWWSPGQWFFIYLFTLPGLPLGIAISLTVLFAAWLGLLGWMKLYRKFQFSETVVLYAGLFILFSRYLFSSFQIYPGAGILEFAAAPWFLLMWLELEKRPLWLQAACLLLLLIASYFVKSSMLIFWLGVIGSSMSLFQLKQIPWLRVLVLLVVFIAGKYCCDWLFTGGGDTPFSSPGQWISFANADASLLVQRLMFILNAPLLATIGGDDYIRYIFQKPGSIIFPNGHPVMLLIYFIVLLSFFFLLRYFITQRKLLNERYSNLMVAVTGVYIVFFLYTFISGKIINAFEESRHMRLAGLILLPLVVQSLQGLMKRYLLVVPALMFGYAVLSSLNKVDHPKVISEKYRVPLGQMNTMHDYNIFKTEAMKADVVYVVNADLKYELDHCKTIYYQDDFTSLDFIQARPKATITGKTMLFMLPERFAKNGKRDAILANFPSANQQQLPEINIHKLKNWELITVSYH